MRVSFIALICLLLGSAPVRGAAVWTSQTVTVYDYTSSVWDGVLAQTVADFNGMLPARAPRLVYQRMAVVACDQVPRKRPKRGIVVCSVAALPAARQWGASSFRTERHTFSRVSVMLADNTPLSLRPVSACHEFMHATTGIGDNYGALPDSSCVWGGLATPGPFDVAYAHKIYRKHRHH